MRRSRCSPQRSTRSARSSIPTWSARCGRSCSPPEGSDAAALLDQTEFTQPALFALEVALFRLLESLGAAPDYPDRPLDRRARGGPRGRCALADDACTLVAARGRLMGALPRRARWSPSQAAERGGRRDASPGSRSRLLAGRRQRARCGGASPASEEAIERAGRRLGRSAGARPSGCGSATPSTRADGADARRVRASPRALTFTEPQIPIVSNLTGALLTGDAGHARPTTGLATCARRCASPTACASWSGAGVTPLPRARPRRRP